MRIGIIGRAFTDRPSRTVISLLLKFIMILIRCDYLLMVPTNGTPVVNVGVVEQSPATSSARLAIFTSTEKIYKHINNLECKLILYLN